MAHMWFLGLLVGGFCVMLLPALIARKLLGIDAGLIRVVFSGFIGLTVGGSLLGPQLDTTDERAALSSVMLGIGLLTSMVALVVLDILVPPGGVRPLTWAQSLRGRVTRVRRYSSIVRIAGRHGLGPYLSSRGGPADTRHELLAVELRQALQAGGTTFVKLGQLMSTRRDLLPEVYVEELSRLQDQVPAAPWPEVEKTLLDALGAPPDEVFAEFERLPLAAASVAQVHAAVLKDGTRVIVKVQRPGIQEQVERDLDIVNRLARSLHTRTGWGRSLGLQALARGFAVALREELDFRVEARNMTAVRQAAEARRDTTVAFPVLHERLSSARVLVMGRIEGVSLGSARPDDEAHGQRLAETLFTALLNQIVYDGVFHADPHPGNILLTPEGSPALLDFGSVGRIDAGLRDAVAGLFLAVDRGDPAALRDALLEVTDRPEDVDEQRLQRALGQFSARHLGHGAVPDTEMFTSLFRIVADFRLAIPPEVAAVFRALGTLEGTLGRVCADFNMLSASRSYASGRIARQLGADSLRDTARDELIAILPVLRRLPRRVDRIGSALEEGRLGMNVRLLADPRDRQVAGELVGRVLLTLLGIFFGISGVQLLGTGGGPLMTPDLSLYALIGYHLLVLSAACVLRTLFLLSKPLA